MSDQDQKLCDSCHERPARHHICNGGSGGGEGQSLCEICITKVPALAGFFQDMGQARPNSHCKFCGGPAEVCLGGGLGIHAGHFDFVCQVCHADYLEYLQQPDIGYPNFNSQDETDPRQRAAQIVAQAGEIMKRLDEYMKQRIQARKAKS